MALSKVKHSDYQNEVAQITTIIYISLEIATV